MDIQTLLTKINNFKSLTAKRSITPSSLGTLLEDIVNWASTLQKPFYTLKISVSDSKTRFVSGLDFPAVWEAMQSGDYVRFIICVEYASGSRNYYTPTCVKSSYISLNAKAGSCELHVASDGTFTISGTNLW